ncbi:MAG TPA: chemotaxis response regulator protein-glutamate methylesterase [Opitutaceae bacterium]|nr:chemotaxis response regulator protein-glutamate methylesterase [Opitutaceae bacterium]
MTNPIKVLVVDDSPVVRQAMTTVLGSDPDIQVIGAAGDPYEAVALMRETAPDVITLDIEMPRMDGVTFLQKLMAQHPLPVLVCSSYATTGSDVTARVFQHGAVDIITKPRLGTEAFLAEARIVICDAVKAAARVRPELLVRRQPGRPAMTAEAPLANTPGRARVATERVIVVGASTGGTQAVSCVLEALPAECPGIVVVQHMPEGFTRSFADTLDSFCRLKVKEAADGDEVLPGHVLIAPGGLHTMLKRQGPRYFVEVRDGPLVSRHRPSVDVLFRSAARAVGSSATGVILTGMGDDGALGLKELKDAGAFTIAQDEESSVVFGMPKEAIKLGAAARILPLDQIAGTILNGR